MRIVVFDLETAGTEARHPDIQVAAIALDGPKLDEIEAFEAKVAFDVGIADPEALKLNSYDPHVWAREAMGEARVVSMLGDFLRQHSTIKKVSKRTGRPYRVARVGGHNVVRFDAPRLERMFKRHDAFLPADIYRPLDTMQLAMWECFHAYDERESYSLTSVCEWLGIRADGSHDALTDVRLCADVMRHIWSSWEKRQ